MVKLLEDQHLIQFLMDLNDVYVVVRGNILMSHPIPQIGQALSVVLQEERQRELQTSSSILGDSSAFLSQHRTNNFPPQKQHTQQLTSTLSSRRTPLFCNYCRRNGHTIDRCFKLQRQKGNAPIDRGRRVVATAQHEVPPVADQEQSTPFLIPDQYDKLLAILSKHDLETSPSTSGDSTGAAMLASKVSCFSASNPDLKWIVDNGATDHITPKLLYFSSYSPLPQDSFITMPNGKKV